MYDRYIILSVCLVDFRTTFVQVPIIVCTMRYIMKWLKYRLQCDGRDEQPQR